MKNLYILLTVLLLSFGGYAQSNSFEEIDHIKLFPPNMELIKAEDFEFEKNGTMMKIGRLLPTNLTTINSGTWSYSGNNKNKWELRISCEGAKASALHFNKFELPEQSQVFVYTIDKSIVLGPYSAADNPDGLEYTIGILPGNDIIIEYINEYDTLTPNITIGAFSYIYRGEEFTPAEKRTGYGTSGTCQVNVNCSEGDNFRKHQRGVARIYAVDGSFVGYCSGSLINNTLNDGKPYFLTANHCGETSSESDFRQWLFRFDYESKDCESTSEPSGYTISGCKLLASAHLNGGSDFLLVELNTTPEYLHNKNAIYNGWDKSNTPSPKGVSIHHPNGDIKKISTYTTSLTSATYSSGEGTGLSNGCWKVYWSETANGYGVTEGGSSGSPIFDNNGLIIGTLTGGTSYCEYKTGADYYAKLSYHWDKNGTDFSKRIQPWLDPNNSGVSKCSYFDPNDNLIVDFDADEKVIKAGNHINFKDNSENIGTAPKYTWFFNGGIPSMSTEANPTVTYFSAGIFDVTLTVNSGYNSITKTKRDYIRVINPYNINDDDYSSISTFPNPASNSINIKLPEDVNSATIRIFDTLGYDLFIDNIIISQLLDVSFLISGSYFIYVKNEKYDFVQKLSIER
jgi:PKD repeat protein